MDAPNDRSQNHNQKIRIAVGILLWLLAAAPVQAGRYKTANFIANAPTEEFAKKVAMTAERWRDRLSRRWLGHELPNWSRPCPIQIQVGQIGAGGQTTFQFSPNPKTGRNEVYGWQMSVQGTRQRILDSVIPHEVSHTIFASYFRRPLPRWADEGAATLAEHASERHRQVLTLQQVWDSNRISLGHLLQMTEYPKNMRDVMTLYAQGYSLVNYLVQRGGRGKFLDLLSMSHDHGWAVAFEKLYGFDDIEKLESVWEDWVIAGSPELKPNVALASNKSSPSAIVRAQSPTVAASGASRPPDESKASTPPKVASSEPVVFEGFLPPQPRRTAVVTRPTEIPDHSLADRVESGREPRPVPLGISPGSAETTTAGISAVETSRQSRTRGRQALPRQAGIGRGAANRDHGYFAAPASPSPKRNRNSSNWSGIGFPTPDVRSP